MTIEYSIEELKEILLKKEDFSVAITASIDVLPLTLDVIAKKFGATLTTVSRWSEGTAAPHPALQRWVFNYLEDRLKEFLESKCESHGS